MNLDLTHKNALVCGSTAGIGKAIAKQLAKNGATVTLVARNEEKLKETLIELHHEKGQKHNYLVADFSNPTQVKEKVVSALQENTWHILINNTGGPKGGPIFSAGYHRVCQCLFTAFGMQSYFSSSSGALYEKSRLWAHYQYYFYFCKTTHRWFRG